MRELEMFVDGASSGNPGPSGIGVVICEKGAVIKNISSYIGNATNNVAEYSALIHGLEAALVLKADTVKVNTDSELLFRQIKKIYKVKHPQILVLYSRALHLMAAFSQIEINFVNREHNRGADKLAKKAAGSRAEV
jgi:ribonuclease HI